MKAEKNTLPPEVWNRIFIFVNQSEDRKNISLVCKSFYELVKFHLWEFQHIKGEAKLSHLQRLSHLPIRKLHLTFPRFREDANDWLKVIGTFTQLEYVHFERVVVNNNHIRRESILFQQEDLALSHLARLVNLRELSVKWLHPGSAGITPLVHLPIEHLYLENWSAGSVGIAKSIGQMSRLKKLEFSASKGCFQHLSNLHQLQELKVLNVDSFSTQELRFVCHLPLETFDISGCGSFLEDGVFDMLGEMKTLKCILIFGCKFNLIKLRSVPGVHVGWRSMRERTRNTKQ